eukprot:CAMPEP_0197182702 /NCGR_PEP_ID=MMETSP1423-20130617/6566_1 /TAXON_ID=476441 /ORGANISM="Pseudo-nitzschia heimii, Strain UNC1101" /LENGTH=911 /DNA_ID=CAMNT_0042633159 /DNA_START=93 /DNA_END=2828 /DNA_ORIENTATION=-
MNEIQIIVKSCAPWESNDQDYAEQNDYLVSPLSSQSYDDHERTTSDNDNLFGIINGFFADPVASRKLLDQWRELSETVCEKKDTTHLASASTVSQSQRTSKRLGQRQQINPIANTKLSPSKMMEESDVAGEKSVDNYHGASTGSRRKGNNSNSPSRERRRRNRTKTSSGLKEKNRCDQKKGEIQAIVSKIHEAADLQLDASDSRALAREDAKNQGCYGGGREKDVVVPGVTLAYDGNELLRNGHLVITHGHRYGLWGKNGVGKSTLFRRIASGRIPGWPLHLTVRMVEQEYLGSDQTIRECLETVNRSNTGGIPFDHIKKSIEEELTGLEIRLVELVDEGAADTEELEIVTMRISELYEKLEDATAAQKEETSGGDKPEHRGNGFGETTPNFNGFKESTVAILKGLSFEASMLDTPIQELSGGWRMKVALVEALCSNPDIILLDEPTNHLDVSAKIFLEDYVLRQNLTLVVVSHDEDFLDAICTDIIKFENQTLEYHVGNYSTFREREEQLWTTNNRIADAAARKEQKAKEFIAKQKSMSASKRRDDNKQRQAREREKKLSRIGLYNTNGKRFKLLSIVKGVHHQASHIQGAYTTTQGYTSMLVDNSQKSFGEAKKLLRFQFPFAAPPKGATGAFAPLINLEDCRFRYDSSNSDSDNRNQNSSSSSSNKNNKNPTNGASWLLRDVTLNVSVGSRVGILGKNGSGKSTLVKLLCGELSPDSSKGILWRRPGSKIASISQHHIERLGDHLERTPVEHLRVEGFGDGDETEIRRFLGRFGLVGSAALQPIGSLSGGQKARLAFAVAVRDPPHVLILDEPTNHLDRESLDSLSEAVAAFAGAVVTVSHHRAFLSRTCNEAWMIRENGRVATEAVETDPAGGGTPFDHVYESYKKSLRRDIARRGRTKARRNQTEA